MSERKHRCPVGFRGHDWKQEASSKRRGSLLLSLILLGVIGFAGYRIWPPMMDLWQRARMKSVEKPMAEPKTVSNT